MMDSMKLLLSYMLDLNRSPRIAELKHCYGQHWPKAPPLGIEETKGANQYAKDQICYQKAHHIIEKFTQRKNVISKIQRTIDKEGQQIIPLLTDLWKRTAS
ncbi:hypothetical protein Tco_0383599 [Tanacetum coccineum]